MTSISTLSSTTVVGYTWEGTTIDAFSTAMPAAAVVVSGSSTTDICAVLEQIRTASPQTFTIVHSPEVTNSARGRLDCFASGARMLAHNQTCVEQGLRTVMRQFERREQQQQQQQQQQSTSSSCMNCRYSDPDNNECPDCNGCVCDDCAGECACCSLITCKACLNPPQCGGCSNAPLFDTYIDEEFYKLLYCNECSKHHTCGTSGPVFDCGMGLICRCSQTSTTKEATMKKADEVVTLALPPLPLPVLYNCPSCALPGLTENALHLHFPLYHSMEMPYVMKCPICNISEVRNF